jgi:hypothetical protein
MQIPIGLGIVVNMAQLSEESDSIIGDMQQTLRKVNLHYADGLYDIQTDLTIRKNKDRENISTRSTKGVSLRGLTNQGGPYHLRSGLA